MRLSVEKRETNKKSHLCGGSNLLADINRGRGGLWLSQEHRRGIRPIAVFGLALQVCLKARLSAVTDVTYGKHPDYHDDLSARGICTCCSHG